MELVCAKLWDFICNRKKFENFLTISYHHSQRGMYGSAIRLGFRRLCKMADAKLAAVPSVDIEEGVFKYVLIKVYGKDESSHKNIVRGYADCEWHSDIYDRSSESCKGLGLETECLGGGRIEHNPNLKLIKVYGYSQGFGKADHAETKRILFDKFPQYDIEISDEGY